MSKDKLKVKIEVEMWGFDVDDEYFTFQYRVKKNGKLLDEGEVNDDYENGNSPSEQRTALIEDYGVDLVLQRVFA